MGRIYFIGAAAVVVFGAYAWGRAAGVSACREQGAATIIQTHRQSIKQQVKIDAETYNRGGDDIRRWLRAGYTIAD